MFPNLEAEQARKGHNDIYVAGELGISGQSYWKKKNKGGFRLDEVMKLLAMYGCPFDYLFGQSSRPDTTTA